MSSGDGISRDSIEIAFLATAVSAGVCLIAALHLPYGFYGLIRLVAIIGGLAASLVGYRVGLRIATVPAILIALIFFAVRGIEKELWQVIDILAAATFSAYALFFRSNLTRH